MRISDWISDVCSSDLVGKSEIEGGHRILQPIEGQIPSQQAEGPRHRFESVDPPARMSCGFAKLDRVPAYVGTDVEDHVGYGGAGKDCGGLLRLVATVVQDDAGRLSHVFRLPDVPDTGRQADDDRSEEHTSELQSLMRT